MNVPEENNCFNCRFYTKAVGERGYCTLYHHETSLPEKACPRHEREQTDESNTVHKPEAVDYKQRRIEKNVIIGTVISNLVLSTFVVFILVVLGVHIISNDELSVLIKSVTLLVGVCIALLTVFLLFYFAKKSEKFRTLEILLAFFTCVITLIAFNDIVSKTAGLAEALVSGLINAI